MWKPAWRTRARFPRDYETLSWLSGVEMFRGNEERALALAQRSRENAKRTSSAQNSADVHVSYGLSLCHAGDFAGAAAAFREVLEGANPYTVTSLLAEWPPCRERFVGSDEHRALEADFGHYAEG